MTPWPLAPLLEAQTIAIIGADAHVSAPLRRKGRGAVDFSLIAVGSELQDTSAANTHLHVGAHPDENHIPLDGAIWRPGLEFNIRYQQEQEQETTSDQRPALLFADTPGLLRALLSRGAESGVQFTAAISLGEHSERRHWHALLSAAMDLTSTPLLYFVLQRKATVEALLKKLAGTLLTPPLALLLPGQDLDSGDQGRLCAAGIPAFSQPAQLFAAHNLRQRALEPSTGQVLALASQAAEAPLLEVALREARLRPASPPELALETHHPVFIAPSRQYKLGRAMRKIPKPCFDVILSCGRVPQAEGVNTLHLSLDDTGTTESVLHGLRALLDAGVGVASVACRGPVTELLDEAELVDEAQTVDVLSSLGLPCAPHAFVTSASAAARVARQSPLPLRLRAIGPSFASPGAWGGQHDGVRGPAATRQAFQDIHFACQDRDPSVSLIAVLVAPRAALPEIRMVC
ncbi:MAG: hypothetical protein JRH20_04260, partial [Deltaproteobacteria bacterium]|nr:hypothetical protein [Deltaproteobacteria bacterium]